MNKSSADVNAAWHDWMCHVLLETHTTMASDRQEKKKKKPGGFPTAALAGPDWHRDEIKSDQ